MNFWSPNRRRAQSVDTLRVAYADLLDHIGVSQEDLDRRKRLNATDVNVQKRSKRFSFRRSVLPNIPVPSSMPSISSISSISLMSTPSSAFAVNTAAAILSTITTTTTTRRRKNSDTSMTNPLDHATGEERTSTTTRSRMQQEQEEETFEHASSDSRLLQGQPEEEDFVTNTTAPVAPDGVAAIITTTSATYTTNSTAGREQYELAAAFRMMAATRSPDKEHGHTSALFLREDSQAMAMASAQAIEKRVVLLIATIGKLVLQTPPSSPTTSLPSPLPTPHIDQVPSRNDQTSVRSDPIFEYFCERSMLSLLVDIAKEKRQESEEGRRWGAETTFVHGVVWSPKVKAQIFATMAALISDCRNPSVIYYLLSNHHANDLIDCMLPLQQWTDQALSIMMPPYVDMLQKVAVQLADDPHLFPFLTRHVTALPRHDDLDPDVPDDQASFPLYSAALETATGAYAQSDSVVYGTCLVVAVNVMQIDNEPIQSWVCNAGAQQRLLADHLCQRLVDRYSRIVNLTTGPVVDGIRSYAIANQLSGLKDHLAMIHEVFWSGVRGLDVRLCESLLQRVVTVLLKNLAPHRRRSFLTGVGFEDSDVIPEQEALAQVSTIFLAFLFSKLAYVPFQRMLAVSLFHEKSTPLFASRRWMQDLDSSSVMENYIFMPLLSDIVTGDHERETCPNSFRSEIIKGLSGQYGEWRATACACLFQAALKSDAMDDDSLKRLQIVPSMINHEYQATPLEEAIATYLTRRHKPSPVAMETLEYVGFLAMQVLHKTLVVHCMAKETKSLDQIELVLASSIVWKAMLQAQSYFATEAHKCQQITGVSDIFLDMIESAVQSRYTARYDEMGQATHRCPLSQRGCATAAMGPEIMIRRMRSVSANDVESIRFFLGATLHMRALCKTIDRFCLSVQHSQSSQKFESCPAFSLDLDLVETADELICTIGGLVNRSQLNADIDLTARMTFPFQPVANPKDSNSVLDSPATRLRSFSIRERLFLVLDPTNMFVVRRQPSSGVDENRATVLCSISLRSVIAAAEDGVWLHVAVRHEKDDACGYFIKNGNMALQLETNGACLIVKQYLDRSRESLRQELMDKVGMFLKQADVLVLDGTAAVPIEEKKTID